MAVSPVCIDLAWSPPDSPAAPLRNEPLAGADSASESKTVMDLTSAVRVARPLAAVGRPEAVRIQPARPSVSVAALLDSSSESDDGVLLAAAAAAGCNVDDADFGGYASSDGDDGSSDQSDRSAARGVKRARDAELDELAPPAKLSKDELKARAKAERTAKKEREKEAKRVERERKKREREAAKAAAKSAAAAERRKESQRRGGFKLQEIEVVLGSAVATTDAGAHIASAVRDLGFATCALPETTCSVVDNAVRWRRRAWLPGREGEAVDARFSAQNHWFPLAARWVEGSTLVRWLERGGADGSREVCAEADRSRRVMAAATRPSAAALAPDPREVRARSASDGGRGASSSSSSGSGGSAGVDVPAAPRQRFLLLVQGAQGAVARGLVSSYESSQSASQSQSQSQTQSQSQSGRRAALVASSTTKEDLVTAEAAMYVEHSVESVFVLDVERCAAHVAGLTKALAELPFKGPFFISFVCSSILLFAHFILCLLISSFQSPGLAPLVRAQAEGTRIAASRRRRR